MCKVSTIGEAEMFTEAILFIQLDLLHSNTSELYEILNKICLVCVFEFRNVQSKHYLVRQKCLLGPLFLWAFLQSILARSRIAREASSHRVAVTASGMTLPCSSFTTSRRWSYSISSDIQWY